MRALSIRQPWAWLIVNGYKDIENRDWKTSYRGKVLVHAGKKIDKLAYCHLKKIFPNIVMPDIKDFEVGGIVGEVTITGCYDPLKADNNQQSISIWYTGHYGFELADAKPLKFMPCKGKLSFFEVDYA